MFNNSGSSVIRITNRCLMKLVVFSCGVYFYFHKRVFAFHADYKPMFKKGHHVFSCGWDPDVRKNTLSFTRIIPLRAIQRLVDSGGLQSYLH